MNKTNIETCFRLAFNMRDVPTVCTCDEDVLACECLDLNDEIAEHYKLSEWSYVDIDAPSDDRCWAWGAISDLERFANDIDAGTVWEPPEEPKLQDIVPEYYDISPQAYERWKAGAPTDTLTLKKIELALQTQSLNHSHHFDPSYFPYTNEALHAKIIADMHTEINKTTFINCAMSAAQNPYQNALNKVLAQQQVITSHDWHHDGNNWACLVCGSKFDPMTPTCSGINAADWTVPVWETEPVAVARTWKHGYCEQCACELSPAMDGEGATQCSKCNR